MENWILALIEVINAQHILFFILYGAAIASLPFVVTKLVAVVISRDNVDEKDVFGFGVHAGHLDLVAREHPPVGSGWRRAVRDALI